MEEITEEHLNKVISLLPEKKPEPSIADVSDEDFKQMLEDMNNPVHAQKHLAVQIKLFLDQRVAKEHREKGFLTDSTRRWVETYNNILEKIQRALHGDKSVNLHLHKVTHGQVALKMREAAKQ